MQRKPRKPKPIKLLPGLLDLLVLQALGNRKLRTRDLARRIFKITQETFEVETGSLMPALRRLRKAESICREVDQGKVISYCLTALGWRRLKAERRRWDRTRVGVQAACGEALGNEEDPDFAKRVPVRVPRRKAYDDF